MTAVPSNMLPIAVSLCIGTVAPPSFAQGTAAQREACAPDAIKLCSDTIPDVPKTTACMKAHVSELSAGCRPLVVGTQERSDGRSHLRTARVEIRRPAPAKRAPALSPPDEDFDIGPLNGSDDAGETPASRAADVRDARRVVRSLCRNDILGADTCRLTNTALDMAR